MSKNPESSRFGSLSRTYVLSSKAGSSRRCQICRRRFDLFRIRAGPPLLVCRVTTPPETFNAKRTLSSYRIQLVSQVANTEVGRGPKARGRRGYRSIARDKPARNWTRLEKMGKYEKGRRSRRERKLTQKRGDGNRGTQEGFIQRGGEQRSGRPDQDTNSAATLQFNGVCKGRV